MVRCAYDTSFRCPTADFFYCTGSADESDDADGADPTCCAFSHCINKVLIDKESVHSRPGSGERQYQRECRSQRRRACCTYAVRFCSWLREEEPTPVARSNFRLQLEWQLKQRFQQLERQLQQQLERQLEQWQLER